MNLKQWFIIYILFMIISFFVGSIFTRSYFIEPEIEIIDGQRYYYACPNGSIANFSTQDIFVCGQLNPINPNNNVYDFTKYRLELEPIREDFLEKLSNDT